LILADELLAACHDEFDISIANAAFCHHVDNGIPDDLAPERQAEPHLLAAGLEAVDVIVQPEEASVPDSWNVIRQVSAKEALVKNGDACIGKRRKFALDPGDPIFVGVVACLKLLLSACMRTEHGFHRIISHTTPLLPA
jgi:hypothetical protein